MDFIGRPGQREQVTPKKNLLELFNSFIYALAFGLAWIVLAWGCVGFAWLADARSVFIQWITLHVRWWWIVALAGFPFVLVAFLLVTWWGMFDPNREPLNTGETARVLPLTPLVMMVRGAFGLAMALKTLFGKPPARSNVNPDATYEDDGIRAGRKK